MVGARHHRAVVSDDGAGAHVYLALEPACQQRAVPVRCPWPIPTGGKELAWETVIRIRWEGDNALPFSAASITGILRSGIMALLGSNNPDVLKKVAITVEDEDIDD